MENFTDISHWAMCIYNMLMERFCCRLNEDICLLMARGQQFIYFTKKKVLADDAGDQQALNMILRTKYSNDVVSWKSTVFTEMLLRQSGHHP